MDWDANFLADQPNAPHNLLVCLSLDQGSQSGQENIIAVAFGDLTSPVPQNLRIENIVTSVLTNATLETSDFNPISLISPGQVRQHSNIETSIWCTANMWCWSCHTFLNLSQTAFEHQHMPTITIPQSNVMLMLPCRLTHLRAFAMELVC